MFSNKLFPSELYPIHLYPRETSSLSPNLSNNVSFTQALISNIDYNKSLSNNITFTQIVSSKHSYKRSLLSNISFTQTTSSKYIYKKSLSTNITFTQIASIKHGYPKSLSSNITFTSTLSYQKFGGKNQSIIDTIPITDFVHYEFIIPPFTHKTVTDHIIFTQSVSFPDKPFINQNLLFTQQLILRRIYHKSLTNTLNLTQIDSGKDTKSKSIIQTLSFNQNNTSIKTKVRKITQTLSITHHFNYDKYLNFNIKHTLSFQDYLTKNTKLNQFLVDVLLFKGGGGYSSTAPNASKIIDGTNVIYQDTIPVIVHRYIQLTGNTTIILPAPLFGDSRTNIASLNIQRMVKGNIKTLIKTTKRQKLNYRFKLKRQKAYELQKFIDDNDLTLLNLENWKGELWQVKITNNPIIFEATEGRYVCTNNREIHEIEIQFEGILLSGSASSC